MSTDRRNVVMVTVDSLRADHCGAADGRSSLTPSIDRLADDGVSYTEAIAPGPRTPSSVPVLFTGEFMDDDDSWTMADWEGRQRRIARHMERFSHLSERMQRRGYETLAFTANPWTTRESRFDVGFDEFTEISADSPDVSSRALSDSPLFRLADTTIEVLPGDPFGWSSKKEWFSQWTGYFELIREAVSAAPEPFFLWVFVLDSHQPYITPRRYREESSFPEMYYSILRYWYGEGSDGELPTRARRLIGQAYRDAVRSVDRFVDELRRETEPYDPVTLFFSDHGEALGEHGNYGHERSLYEENLRVPFFVHGVGSDETVADQVSLRSVPDLLANVADGSSFRPRTYTRPFVVSRTENGETRSVRSSRWKLISAGQESRLHDLRSDPGETIDVAEDHPEVASSLRELLGTHETTQAEKEAIGRGVQDMLDGGTRL